MTAPAGGPNDQSDLAEPASSLDRRRTIIGAVVTILTLGLIFLRIIPAFGGYADAWTAIQGMSSASLVALGISVVFMVVAYVWPYQAALPGLGFKAAFVIRQTSFMVSNSVPAGGAFGVALQFAMLRSYAIGLTVATAGIAVTSLWSVLMTLTLPVMGVFAALSTGQIQSRWIWIAVVGLLATIASVLALWLILRSEASARRVGAIGDRLASPLNNRRAEPVDVTGSVLELRESTKDVLAERWRWVTISNYLVVLAQFAVLYLAIRGIEGGRLQSISIAGAFAAFTLARIASMIPITPGGLGTVDAAQIALLVTFGMSQGDAVAATLVWRAASFLPQVCLGIATFLYWRFEQARAGAQPASASRN